jgi:hypothetical protein
MFLLSILIPTKNRQDQIKSTISILTHYIESLNVENEVEIVISNNSDHPLEGLNSKYLRILESNLKFETAEENLFSLLKEAQGQYVWPLGDDEIPIKDSFQKLLELCRNQTYEAMVWNSRILGIDGESLGHSRIKLNKEILEITYEEFLLRTGYWSIPAGISLTVFKNNLNDFDFMKEVFLLKSPIYSHVTYYAYIFSKVKFGFVNFDLVHYQTNRHDVLPKKSNHWFKYTQNSAIFFRYPWTLGFIRQLKLLEEHKIIKESFLDNALDISHFGRRFKLSEKVIELVLDQVILELSTKQKNIMTKDELDETLRYLEIRIPRYSRTFELIKTVKNEKNSYSRKHNLAKLTKHRSAIEFANNRLPFHGYYRFIRSQYLVYETPLGWIAVKPNLDNLQDNYTKDVITVDDLCLSLNNSLTWALNGIEIPINFQYYATSKSEIERKLKSEEVSKPNEYESEILFFLSSEKYVGQNNQPKTKALIVWEFLPMWVRSLVKKTLLS